MNRVLMDSHFAGPTVHPGPLVIHKAQELYTEIIQLFSTLR